MKLTREKAEELAYIAHEVALVYRDGFRDAAEKTIVEAAVIAGYAKAIEDAKKIVREKCIACGGSGGRE